MKREAFRRFWYSLPLGSKIIGLATFLVVGVVFILTYLTIQREKASFQQQMESQVNLLLETLPVTMRDNLYRLEVDDLNAVAKAISDNENVSLFKVYDRRGVLLVDASQQDDVFSQEPDPQGVTLVQVENDEIVLTRQDNQLIGSRAVMIGSQTVGAVSIGLSTQPLQAKIQEVTLRSLIIAVAALASGMALAILLTHQMTSPLIHLADVSQHMANGDLSQRVQLHYDDEVGRMGRAFNQMAEAVQKRETELTNLAVSLERTVAFRTAELQDQNEALIRMNQELDQARLLAEEATRLKSQFLATMSHELRTPLNAILGFTQILMEGILGPLTEKQMQRLERIYSNGEHLLEMINDLLDLAKIEAGRVEITSDSFELEEVLRELTDRLEGLAHEKGLEFTVTVDDAMPPRIMGDSLRLKQIATNLISNAIKFTDKGSITIQVMKEGPDRWSLEVTDTGIGIPPDALGIIFDEFRQVDGSTQRKHGGTGLGLAITKKLVTMMDGKIEVTSTVGEGSSFTVTLPLMVTRNEAKEAQPQS